MVTKRLDNKLVVDHFDHKVAEAYDHNHDLVQPVDIDHSLVLVDLKDNDRSRDLNHLDRLSKDVSTSMTSVSVALQFVSIMAQAACFNKRLLVTQFKVTTFPGSQMSEHRHQSHNESQVSTPWEVLAYL